eukprot:Pgem_evm1s8406
MQAISNTSLASFGSCSLSSEDAFNCSLIEKQYNNRTLEKIYERVYETKSELGLKITPPAKPVRKESMENRSKALQRLKRQREEEEQKQSKNGSPTQPTQPTQLTRPAQSTQPVPQAPRSSPQSPRSPRSPPQEPIVGNGNNIKRITAKSSKTNNTDLSYNNNKKKKTKSNKVKKEKNSSRKWKFSSLKKTKSASSNGFEPIPKPAQVEPMRSTFNVFSRANENIDDIIARITRIPNIDGSTSIPINN